MLFKSSWVTGLLLLLGLQGSVWAQGPLRYVAGQHYSVLDKPLQPAAAGTVDIIEFFTYGCSHCDALDEDVSHWSASLPQDTHFRRVPVLFGQSGENYARMFYSADKLGTLDEMHSMFFTAIHDDGEKLTSIPAIARFMAGNSDVDRSAAEKMLASKAVDMNIAESVATMRAFRVTAVPSLGIAGKYWVTARQAGSNEAMFKVADFLIQREQTRQ